MDGRFIPKCGSPAKIGFPVEDFSPETAQLLLPFAGFGFSIISEIESKIIWLSGISVLFSSIKLQSVSFGITGSFTSKKSGKSKSKRSLPNLRNALVYSKSSSPPQSISVIYINKSMVLSMVQGSGL